MRILEIDPKCDSCSGTGGTGGERCEDCGGDGIRKFACDGDRGRDLTSGGCGRFELSLGAEGAICADCGDWVCHECACSCAEIVIG